MKLPQGFSTDIFRKDEEYKRPYPPLGFYPINVADLGNGDQFGLYWAIGREEEEPLVAETYHDDGTLQPHFSSWARFQEYQEQFKEEFPLTPTIEEDPLSPLACLHAAREALTSQSFEVAIFHLEIALTILPEYTDALCLLHRQYRRLQRNEDAIKIVIQAIISPSCFGRITPDIFQWFSKQREASLDIKRNPLWQNREKLTMRFGGTKHNDDYLILKEAIDFYLEETDWISAMTLMQTYAGYMYWETISFQERYGFESDKFVAWQKDVAVNQYKKRQADFWI